MLPTLRRLTLHELASVGDRGAARIAAARQLQALDIWSLPTLTDATAEVIAGLPAIEEISIRETGMTEAAALKFAALPGLQSLTFKNNGPLSAATVAKIKERRWKKLDLGGATATPVHEPVANDQTVTAPQSTPAVASSAPGAPAASVSPAPSSETDTPSHALVTGTFATRRTVVVGTPAASSVVT